VKRRLRGGGLLATVPLAALALALAAPAQGASGIWERAWGDNVNGGGAFEVCTVAASCLTGTNSGGLGGDMWNPAGLALDSGGNLYVADSGNNRIQKFDSTGAFERMWGKGVDTGGGNLCTAASGDVCTQGADGGLKGEMFQPSGVAVDPGGNVYVADYGNNRIEKFSASGVFERTWGKGVDMTTGGNLCTLASGDTCQAGAVGGLSGEINQPLGVATDSAANVYVADTNNDRIQKFDSAGTFDRAWGKGVDMTTGGNLCTLASGDTCQAGSHATALGGEMNSPAGVAIDSGGNVFVADALNNRIQKFSSSGTWDRAWGVNVNGGGVFGICTSATSCLIGSSGGQGGQMFFPISVGTDAGGGIYVADYANNRIQKFDSSGTWDRAWGKGVNGGSAYGICTVASGCQVGTTGGLGGEMDTPDGVLSGPGGKLYVADYGNNRIQEFGDPVVTPPPPTPPGSSSQGPTGRRAAALKKCKKKPRAARAKCKKKAKRLPI
jgi:DNA-binding beta-propeller fold protein YncE